MTSVEAMVGSSDAVYVGRIVRIETPAGEESKPVYDRTSRIVFAVSETIRGPKIRETVFLNRSHHSDLDALRDLKVELLYAIGQGHRGWDPEKRYVPVDPAPSAFGTYGYLHSLAPIKEAKSPDHPAADFDVASDQGRMFGADLSVVRSRKDILKRAREYQRKHPETVGTVELGLPDGYFDLVGYHNAFGIVALPKTAETGVTLRRIVEEPERLLARYRPRDWAEDRNRLVAEAVRVLSEFPDPETKALVSRIADGYRSPGGGPTNGWTTDEKVRETARRVLDKWAGDGRS
ncbi:MAG: hypothetical protein JST30_15885 [Armatimonadetes bacterium]|nr:hypothetical protein [Armatimonadota bacterium]